jgi:hypothetical protein
MILRRRSRAERWAAEVGDLSPFVRAVLVTATAAAVIGLAYVARRRLFAGVAVVAEAVEEVADTVEDAAEDLADTARERAAATSGE